MSNRVCEILGIEKPVISAAMVLNKYYMQNGGFLKGMRLGIKDEGIINSDHAINNITSIKTCKEVVDELNIFA